MNSYSEHFNPDQQSNAFYPIKYDQITRWIDRLSPGEVTQLGWHSTDDLWDAVTQEYSLYEQPKGTDEIQ